MSMKSFCTILVLMVVITRFIHADTVFLKDGSRCNGEIVSDGPEGLTIEYFATETIRDQKTIAHADIDRVEKIPPDLKAFERLGSLDSPPTLMDTTFHDALLEQKIPKFAKQYPYSSKIEVVRGRIKALEDERARIRQGDRRLDGTWLTAAEIAADPYQWEAGVKYAQMKTAANSNNPVEALRRYEHLENEFPGSGVMPDAVVLALKQLDQLQGTLASAKANGDLAGKNRAKAIAAAPPDQAKVLKDAVDREVNISKEVIKKSTADGSKFFPVFQNSKEALDALQGLIVAERARLTLLQNIPMSDGIASAKECGRLIKEGKLKEAQEQLELSQKLWPANIENAKIKDLLDQLVKAEAETAKKQAPPVSASSSKS